MPKAAARFAHVRPSPEVTLEASPYPTWSGGGSAYGTISGMRGKAPVLAV